MTDAVLTAAIKYVKTGDTDALKQLQKEQADAAKSGKDLALTTKELGQVSQAVAARQRELKESLVALKTLGLAPTHPAVQAINKELQSLSQVTPKVSGGIGDITKSLGQFSPAMGWAVSHVQSFVGGLADIPVAGQIAIGVVAGLTAEVVLFNKTQEEMLRGGKLRGGEVGFQRVAGPNYGSLLEGLRQRTDRTISSQDLENTAEIGLNSGLSERQLDRITSAVNNLSAAYKRELGPMLQEQIPAASAGALRGLRQFGLGIDEITKLEAQGGDRTEVYIRGLEGLSKKVGEGADQTADAVERLRASQKNLRDEWDQDAATAFEKGGVVDAMNALSEGVEGIAPVLPVVVSGMKALFDLTPPGWLFEINHAYNQWRQMAQDVAAHPNTAGLENAPLDLGPGTLNKQRSFRDWWLNRGGSALGIPDLDLAGYGELSLHQQMLLRTPNLTGLEKPKGRGGSRGQDATSNPWYLDAMGQATPDWHSAYSTYAGSKYAGMFRPQQYGGGFDAANYSGHANIYDLPQMPNWMNAVNDPSNFAAGGAFAGAGGGANASGNLGNIDIYGHSLSRTDHIAKLMNPSKQMKADGSMETDAEVSARMGVGRRMTNRGNLMQAGANIAVAGAQGGARAAGQAAIQEGLALVAAANPGLAIPLAIAGAFVPGLFKPHDRKPTEAIPMRLVDQQFNAIMGVAHNIEHYLTRGIPAGGRDSIDMRAARGRILGPQGGAV